MATAPWWSRDAAADTRMRAEAVLRGDEFVATRRSKRVRIVELPSAPVDDSASFAVQDTISRSKHALLTALRDRIVKSENEGAEATATTAAAVGAWDQSSLLYGAESATHPLVDAWSREFSSASPVALRTGTTVDLEVVPKAWDDEHLRVANENEQSCANANCEGLLLLGERLVVFRTPKEACGAVAPRSDALCLCCLRASVTRNWLRAFSQKAPVHRVAQPFRSLAEKNEYGYHALIPRATETFYGVANEFVQHVRTRYVVDETGKRLRQVDVDFEEVPHQLLRRCMVESIRRHRAAEGPSVQTAREVMAHPRWRAVADAVASPDADVRRRVVVALVTRGRPDLSHVLLRAIWMKPPDHVTRLIRAAIPLGLGYKLHFQSFRKQVPSCVSACGDACAVASFALMHFLGMHRVDVVGTFTLSSRAEISSFVARHPAVAMAAILVLVVREVEENGVVMEVLCAESATDRNALRGACARLRAVISEAANASMDEIEVRVDAVLARMKINLKCRAWFWTCLEKSVPIEKGAEAWNALSPYAEFVGVDPRWAYDAPESLCFALRDAEAQSTLAALAAIWRDANNRQTLMLRMRRECKRVSPDCRRALARLASFVVRSFQVRCVPAPAHWGNCATRDERIVLFCASCRKLKTQFLVPIEQWLRTKRTKNAMQATKELWQASQTMGSVAVNYDAETRQYFCAKRRNGERNKRGAEGVLERLASASANVSVAELVAEVMQDDQMVAASTSASAKKKPKSSQSCNDAPCFGFRAHGHIVEFYGKLITMCWRCGSMCMLPEFGQCASGVECGWCTARNAAKRCHVCQAQRRNTVKLPWSTLVVLRGPENPTGLSEINLCPSHSSLRAAFRRPVHEWSLLSRLLATEFT